MRFFSPFVTWPHLPSLCFTLWPSGVLTSLLQEKVALDSKGMGSALYGTWRAESECVTAKKSVITWRESKLLAGLNTGCKCAMYYPHRYSYPVADLMYVTTFLTLSTLTGLHSMSSDVPQVRALLSALAGCIFISEVRHWCCTVQYFVALINIYRHRTGIARTASSSNTTDWECNVLYS